MQTIFVQSFHAINFFFLVYELFKVKFNKLKFKKVGGGERRGGGGGGGGQGDLYF